ncbi:MAG: SusC/RagA family TonB-linked outer membrane protein [Cyclobacteriaceae bacterium]|jgi:TonB-linked SusC/RagA family outer membrane protein
MRIFTDVKFIFPTIFAVFLGSTLFAQSRTITGTVTSAGEDFPLPGVNVIVQGSSSGTITDVEGKYSISANETDVLVFSFVGYTAEEVTVSTISNNTFDIALMEDVTSLSEVVVVGYGTQEKKEITSAVTSVSPQEFNKGNISDVAQLLQGKVAGLSISRPGGDPNNGFAIRLRGLSTLGANTQPLVVIDGQIGADLGTVDPNDIASIDVLKDGSAAAIYGTRGSAGVLIVTTKSGSYSGDPKVNYNALVEIEQPSRFTPHMSASEFRALDNSVDYGADTDWYDEISRTAVSHTHNLSLSGGSEAGTSYSASLNYRNAQGVAINTGFDQLNGRLTLAQTALDDRLVFNLNLSTTRRESALGYGEAFKYAAIYNPTSPVFSDDPIYDITGSGYFEVNAVDYANPVAVLNQNSHDQETKKLNVVISGEYEIFEGLRFLARYTQQTTSIYQSAYLPRTSFHSRNFLGVSGSARGGYAWKRDFEGFNQLYENILTYNTAIDVLNISALAGYSYQDFEDKQFTAEGGNFVTNLSSEDFSTALDFSNGRGTVDSYRNGSKLVAFFGRVNLNFDDFAFLSASLRREGSTQFGANNKWGMFPAVSVGMDMARVWNIPQANNLKLRASYGVTGSLPPDPYLSLRTLAPGGAQFYAGNDTYLQSYEPNKNPNPDLKWETKAEFDIGLDFSLLDNDRLTGTFDYYNRTTSDLIFNVTVPVPPNLVPNTWKNIGKLKSSGVELALGYDVIRQTNFSWNTGINFSTYNVRLAELDPSLQGSYVGATNLGTPGQEQTQITRAVEGEDIGILWGWRYAGIDEGGSYYFDNIDGDSLNVNDLDDQTIIGNGLPDFEMGWSNTFTYGNFDLNFLIRGSFGHDLINTYRAFYENPNVASTYNVVKSKYYNPNITDGQVFSSLFVEDASFVKLDNLTLGYTFKLSEDSWFSSLRAFVTGRNLFVITDYTGVDPEVRYSDGRDADFDGTSSDVNVLAPGVDRRDTWVLTRSYAFGINVQF